MKKISLLFTSLMSISLLLAQGIEFFEGSFEEALSEARKENKLIFVDAYTTWCGPCKAMSKNVFTEGAVGDYYNDKFINLKLDQEKGEGMAFAQSYDVRYYPTLLFINYDKELAHKAVGGMNANEFIQLGKAANSSATQMRVLQKKYADGNLKPEKIKELANIYLDAYIPESEELALAYIKTQENWKEAVNLEFIYRHFPSSMESEMFKFIVNEKELFVQLTQDASVLDERISGAITSSLIANGEATDSEIDEVFKNFFPASWQREAEKFKISSLASKPETYNEDEFIARQIAYFQKYGSSSWQELNSLAWSIYESSENVEFLEAAKAFAKESIDLDTNYYNTDTYTWICAKLGDSDSASKYAVKAIKLGEADGADVSELVKLVESYK